LSKETISAKEYYKHSSELYSIHKSAKRSLASSTASQFVREVRVW